MWTIIMLCRLLEDSFRNVKTLLIKVAIKEPLDNATAVDLEQFQRDCARYASVNHPNIVRLLGMGRRPRTDMPFAVFEFM